MAKRYSYVPPGGGPNSDWSADHTFDTMDDLGVEHACGLTVGTESAACMASLIDKYHINNIGRLLGPAGG